MNKRKIVGTLNNDESPNFFTGIVKDYSKTILTMPFISVLEQYEDNDTLQGGEENMNKIGYRIRKLTVCEVFRLMGLTDEDVQKAKAVGVSDGALYEEGGNGIVTNCVELLAEHLYKAQINGSIECTDELIAKQSNDYQMTVFDFM